MAILLKRQFSLVALTVELQTRGDAAKVKLALEVTEEQQSQTIWCTTLDAQQIGLTPRITGGQPDAGVSSIVLPPEVPKKIRDMLLEQGYAGPVWLHLIKPYGVLGALPWERLLAGCGHVVLRLPDALADSPTEAPRTLNVIICASRPRSEEHFNIPAYLARMAETIVGAVAGPEVRVYVFADLECTREITARLSAAGLIDTSVFVFDPESSRDYRLRRGTSGEYRAPYLPSPWLQWMAKSMDGKSVDVVHFLCHGYMAERSGSLAFAESPVLNQDPEWCRFVGAGELGRFLISVGAWSVAFTSPERNYSPLGLRALADEFAQVRPGPVMHHDSEEDHGFAQLGAAYRFLYSNERCAPVPTPAIALCCQPALVNDERKADDAPVRMRGGTRATAPMQEVPAWVASTHRFVEQKEYEIRRTRKTNVRFTSRSQKDLEGIARGVDEIKLTLERLEKKGVLS